MEGKTTEESINQLLNTLNAEIEPGKKHFTQRLVRNIKSSLEKKIRRLQVRLP